MIKLNKVAKKYGNQQVLNNINITFPDKGFVAIVGPSGCGKSTLLNAISTLIDFDGDIIIDNIHTKYMSEEAKYDLRLNEIGFIFQDYKLYETSTVLENILLPLKSSSNKDRNKQINLAKDLLKIVKLQGMEHKMVNTLSGGEKQRVAIARSLVNTPRFVLADEPTGSLDFKNSEFIMDILKNISASSLVIVVSHDFELVKNYADMIVTMRDGQITDVTKHEKIENKKHLPIRREDEKKFLNRLPIDFAFKHSYSKIKNRKFRTLICTGITSLGLFGLGLSISLSSSISETIKNSYSSIMNDNRILVNNKSKMKLYGEYATSPYQIKEILDNYSEYFIDYGVYYDVDFESFFIDQNTISLYNSNNHEEIKGLSIRNVNEFRWLEENTLEMYPHVINELNNDEVILSLTIDTIEDICYKLQIPRRVKSLSDYLLDNKLMISFNLTNLNWNYDDQQLLTVKGFILDTNNYFWHSNHLWNEYFFESQMGLPVSEKINVVHSSPWMMSKLYYLNCNTNIEQFLKETLNSEDLCFYIFDFARKDKYPILYNINPTLLKQRLLVYVNTTDAISPMYTKYILENQSNLKKPIFASIGGYSIYPANLMSGFSYFTYFSFSKDLLDNFIDVHSHINVEANETLDMPDGIKCGHYSNSMQNGVIFDIFDNKLIYGRSPENYNEIVISNALAKNLFGSTDVLNRELFIASNTSSYNLQDETNVKEYSITSLKVVGIKNDSRNAIYHDSEFTVLFFQLKLNISRFYLGTYSLSFEVNEGENISQIVKDMNRKFPNFETVYPLEGVFDEVDNICHILQIVLMIFSLVATIISVMLLIMSNYLFVIENTKDIALARCLGIKKKESGKILIYHSMIIAFISFVIASIEIVLATLLISFEMNRNFYTGFSINFNPLSFLSMFVLGFVVSLLTSLMMSSFINKIEPLDAIKW